MPKFAVTLADGRTVEVYAPDEGASLYQANHQETTRITILAKRGHPIDLHASIGVSAAKLKD